MPRSEIILIYSQTPAGLFGSSTRRSAPRDRRSKLGMIFNKRAIEGCFVFYMYRKYTEKFLYKKFFSDFYILQAGLAMISFPFSTLGRGFVEW